VASLRGAGYYDRHGHGYAEMRREDPRIAAQIHAALGDARTVINIGAGAGSYEPGDRYVLAVEPSATMRAQRPPAAVPAIDAVAESLPMDDDTVDAAMAISTIHHWSDPWRGLCELRRVARGPVVVLTFDLSVFDKYWLVAEYGPELAELERARFPTVDAIAEALGGARVEPVTIGADTPEGMVEAYFGRPEAYLDQSVRNAQSVWRRLPEGIEERIVGRLTDDLATGGWDERHQALRTERDYCTSMRLIVAE
jgi:SAM-dependent methyltransferase